MTDDENQIKMGTIVIEKWLNPNEDDPNKAETISVDTGEIHSAVEILGMLEFAKMDILLSHEEDDDDEDDEDDE